MTDQQKIQAYDRTLEMLEVTGTFMKRLNELGELTDHGKGSLDRIISTVAWMKGERGNEED